MTSIRHLRASRDAALDALERGQNNDTLTASELKRLHRDFREAHAAWVDAVADAATTLTEAAS